MKVSRRQFISWGLAAGTVLGVQGMSQAFFGHVMRTSSRPDTPIPSACRACPAGCGIVGYLREKKWLVAIMGNPEHPASKGKVCALALAAINLHYHPERLLQARRADDSRLEIPAALEEAGARIGKLATEGARVVLDTWDEQPAQANLLAALGDGARFINREAVAGAARRDVMKAVWGTEVRPYFEQLDLLLIFGANPFEGGPHFIQDARRIIDQRASRQMKMVVFDPRLSNTGGRADLWVPIKPGTDRVAALALIRYTLEHINLSQRMLGNMGQVPLGLLGPVVDRYDLETAAKICGVPASLLEEAGQLIVASRSPATMAGGGVFDQIEALSAYRAIAFLDALLGPYQVPVMTPPNKVPANLSLNPLYAEEFYRALENGSDEKIVLISHRTNPVYDRGGLLGQALRSGKVAYHLAITPFMNETAQLADLSIPEALPIESSGRVWLTSYVLTPTYVEQRPIVQPPSGVLTAEEIFLRLARQLGGSDRIDVDYDLAQMRDLTGALDFMPIGEGIFAGDADYLPQVVYKPSVKELKQLAELAAAEERTQPLLLLHGSAVTNADSAQAKWLAEINHAPRLFINPVDARKWRVRTGDRVRLTPAPEPAAVTVENKPAMPGSPEITATVFVSDGVRPGCVAMNEGQGHIGAGRLAAAKCFKSELDPDTRLLWWENEGNGTNLSPLVRLVIEPDTGTLATPPARLKVEEA